MSDSPSSAGSAPAGRRLHDLIRYGSSFSGRERNCCFLNLGDGRFANVSSVSGLDFPDDGRALAWVDWDRDGDLDVWCANRSGPQARFLRNDVPSEHHFVSLRLEGRTCNRDAVGARVELQLKDQPPQLRTLRAGEGFLAQSSKWLHFGLGSSPQIERLTVHWPGGVSEEFDRLAPDHHYRIVQGSGRAQRCDVRIPATELEDVALASPVEDGHSRVISAAMLPLPPLEYRTFQGNTRTVAGADASDADARPMLLNLWASWCKPCVREMKSWGEQAAALQQTGLKVLALSVDGLEGDAEGSDESARQAVARLGFPFPVGLATEATLEKLQLVHDQLFDLHTPLVIPTSLLIDSSGHVAAIYRGPVSVDQLVEDVAAAQDEPRDRLAASVPFPGRWRAHRKRLSPFELAWNLLEEGYLEDASRYIEQTKPLLERDRDFPMLLSQLGTARLQRGDPAATEIYREALRRSPGDARAHYNLGLALQAQGNIDEAVEQYRQALADSDEDAKVHNNLAAALAGQGKLDEAVNHFRRVTELEPDYAEGQFNLGNALFAANQVEAAIHHYRRAIELNPDYAKAQNNLAVALKKFGQLDESSTVTTPAAQARRAAHRESLDPSQDGWDTEVIAEGAKKSLEALADKWLHNDGIQAADLAGQVAADFRGGSLRPAQRARVFHSPDVSVWQETPDTAAETPAVFSGPAGLSRALDDYFEPLREAEQVHFHAKIVQVTSDSHVTKTEAIVESSGRIRGETIQQHNIWICEWQRGPAQALRLRSITTRNHQEVIGGGLQETWFSDCTEAVLQDNKSFRNQLAFGLNHWLARVGRLHGMHTFARYGLAVGDANADGLDDLYICQPGGLPNRLFLRNPEGTATDASEAAGVNWLDHTSSALFVDLDNDGDQDLVLATETGLLVLENDPIGRFHVRSKLRPSSTDFLSLTSADFDNDGDLDLYACVEFANRQAQRAETSPAFVYHDANDGGANVLYRNDIQTKAEGTEWQFTDVTRETGMDQHNRRHSLAAAWEDFDNDGDPDVYVANDYGQNCLYRNDGGRFVDVAEAVGVVDFGSGMSVSWGDYNQDGWMDLYVANMFSSAGNRVTRQDRFRKGEADRVRSLYGRFAKGNSLFQNQGGEQFREVGAEAAVEMGRWAWSSLFADLNNDGWEDLLVANGYITTEDTGDL